MDERPYTELTTDEIRQDVKNARYDSPMGHLYDPRWARGADRCFRCGHGADDHLTLTVKRIPGQRYRPEFEVFLPNGDRIGVVDGAEKKWRWGQGAHADWYGFYQESKREAVASLFRDWFEQRPSKSE